MENNDSVVTYENERDFEVKALVGWFYIVVGTFGCFSNGFIFVATLTKRKIKTPVYAFIVNLALSDVFLAFLLAAIFTLHLSFSFVLRYFYICKIFEYCITVTQYCQFFTLTAIIVSLFTKQPQRRMWGKVSIVMCLLAWWYIGAHFGFTKAYYTEVWEIGNEFRCEIDYSSYIARFTLISDAVTVPTNLLVPLAIGMVVHKIRTGDFYNASELNSMFIVMVLIQALLALPVASVKLLRLLKVKQPTDLLLNYLPEMICFLSFAYRPVLYVFMNEDLREKFKNLLSLKVSQPAKAYEAASQEEI